MSNVMIEMDAVSYAHRRSDEEAFIHELTWSVLAGQWVALAGPNGSGKSTLVKLLNGLLPKRSGTILIGGTELTAETVGNIRERIGFVFQHPDNQFVGLTVAEDIAFGLENRCLSYAEMQERIRHYAELLNITDLLERHPSELSGGQKQRVAIAAILATEPEIVIFDEATSMLDEHAKQEMLSLMKEMHKQGKYTIISVTHDLDEMLAGDRLVIMSDGKLAADDSPSELLKQDELVERYRLKQPFALQLSKELRNRGMEIDICMDEERLVDAIWAYYSMK